MLTGTEIHGAFCEWLFNSDKNSPCCQSCQFVAAGEKCREAEGATCEKESLCTGTGAECPKSAPMADGTPCPERGQCKQGRCIPYCETLGKQSCMCDKCKPWTAHVEAFPLSNIKLQVFLQENNNIISLYSGQCLQTLLSCSSECNLSCNWALWDTS